MIIFLAIESLLVSLNWLFILFIVRYLKKNNNVNIIFEVQAMAVSIAMKIGNDIPRTKDN